MKYIVLYDIASQAPFSWEVALIALVFVAVGTIWAIVQRSKDRELVEPPSRARITTPKILIAFGSIIALVGCGLMGWDHWRLLKAIKNGEAKVVEGTVQSWGTERVRTARIDKREYHLYERFYVGDSIWFGFYRDVGQAGFHNGGRETVDLHDGLWVRATYVYADGADDPPRIVKLETLQNTIDP